MDQPKEEGQEELPIPWSVLFIILYLALCNENFKW